MSQTPQAAGGIRLSPGALKWIGSVYYACFLTFVPDDGEAADRLHRTVRRAVAEADISQSHVTDDEYRVRGVAVVNGHEALHIRVVYDLAPRAAVRAWTTALADALAREGLTGILRRPLPEYGPEAATLAGLYAPAVTTHYYGRRHLDRNICSKLTVAHGLDQYRTHDLSGGSEFTFQLPWTQDLVDSLPELIDRTLTLGGRNDDEGSELATLCLSSRKWEAWVRRGTREEQVERARAALALLAPDVNHAWVEVLAGLHGYHSGPTHPPGGAGKDLYTQRPDVWTRRVVDAHGLQVLTQDHLDQATDLSGWRATRHGDRYLVEARDLHPWFAQNRPDPETLERARADFGTLIWGDEELRATRAMVYLMASDDTWSLSSRNGGAGVPAPGLKIFPHGLIHAVAPDATETMCGRDTEDVVLWPHMDFHASNPDRRCPGCLAAI